MQQQGRADTNGCARHCRNQGFVQRHHHAHQAEHGAVHVAGRGVEKVLEVVASAEALGTTGDEDDVDLRVFRCSQQQVAQEAVHGVVQGVEFVWSVQGQGHQALIEITCNQVVHGKPLLWLS
ncbi:hypothetical protein D3C78_1375010 [compost metagenome]